MDKDDPGAGAPVTPPAAGVETGDPGPETLYAGAPPPPHRPRDHAARPRRFVVAIVAGLAGAGIVLAVLLGWAATTHTTWTQCLSPDRQATETRQLQRQVQAELTAVVEADQIRLSELLAADFTHVTPTGDAWNRDEFLDWLRPEDLDFRSIEARQPLEIRWSCRDATVTYRSRIDVTVDTVFYRHDARHTEHWEFRDGRSVLVWSQIVAIGGFPPATP